MPSPFPGMDPYLEQPALWQDVHAGAIAHLRRVLGLALQPKYFVRTEERTYVADSDDLLFVGRPDVLLSARPGEPPAGGAASSPGAVLVDVPTPDVVREVFLEVRRADTREVVTVLELLSPTNKLRAGEGRQLYERKRRQILGSLTHLVEVDLIRRGEPMPVLYVDPSGADYRILVSRGDLRPRAELFLFSVRDPIPRFRLPLLDPAEEPEVDLRAALDEVYDSGAYAFDLDYAGDPSPALRAEEAAWADALLRDAGRRSG
ncbi:MAG: DUF4058 family protein [Planctomycetota bacterium]